MSHEVTKTWEIDGKYHVKPSVGANKGKTLKIFNTEEAANKWAEQRSRNYKPRRNMAKKQTPYYDSILRKLDKSRRETVSELDTEVDPDVEDPKPRKKKKKSRGPVAAMVEGGQGLGRLKYNEPIGTPEERLAKTAALMKKSKDDRRRRERELAIQGRWQQVGGSGKGKARVKSRQAAAEYRRAAEEEKKSKARKSKGPVAAMPGSHKQNRVRY